MHVQIALQLRGCKVTIKVPTEMIVLLLLLVR